MTHYNDDMDEEVVCPWCGELFLDTLEGVFDHEGGIECDWCHRLFKVRVHFTAEKMES